MIGIVLAGYGAWPAALAGAAAQVRGHEPDLAVAALARPDPLDPASLTAQRRILAGALMEADRPAGVLVLADMADETAANLAQVLLLQNRSAAAARRLVTGTSLPMLVAALDAQARGLPLAEAAELAVAAARAGAMPIRLR